MKLLTAAARDLPPAYFALVMATGIISIAAHMLGLHLVGRALLYLNGVFYAVLWLLNGLRLTWFTRRMLADMTDAARGPGYFTWIAATSVLGGQCVAIEYAYWVATALFVLASLLWLGLSYTVLASLAIRSDKSTLASGINGGWLLIVVATQSIAVLAADIGAHWPQPFRLDLNFLALAMWLAGGMLYVWVSTLIFYRYFFFELVPADLMPTYWIDMGATAISTLAGSLLITNSAHAPYLHSVRPFLEGMTVFYWAVGSWWIPLLLLLGFWQHVIRRVPLVYNPLYWGLVFPLGMYAAATEHMSRSMKLSFLWFIPDIFFCLALLAWGITLFGLLRHMAVAGKSAARGPS
ncbi:tellurite resistance/C4-dicarboxylate transporter family protein [Salinisphaera sp. LB1]|uniref:tellurite resistance/C4-dicarboxylate transporter family protein n=1 Tax=Salinisphaera sp. LB1 TaxID=2183911 RepID=UPI000D7E3BE7|nr:tellurite resistance/C4-dicarboxylate transporter family protein [Salinisphaera sp. LB1]AWN17932.1 C4-dicarboxylate transporter/malic acid transport protein [Salinisphaera sp. LB1]